MEELYYSWIKYVTVLQTVHVNCMSILFCILVKCYGCLFNSSDTLVMGIVFFYAEKLKP
jgi:hypothetical protein